MAQPLIFPGTPQPEDPLESPEVLMINALLDAPEGFRPEAYGISKHMLLGWTKAWQFCQDYQDKTGSPPTRGLLSRSFPGLEMVTGVSPTWAADKVRQAHSERELKLTMREALNLVTAGQVEQAREVLARLGRVTTGPVLTGQDVMGLDTVCEADRALARPMPWAPLQKATGGLSPGELMLVGARTGQGKSWLLPIYAAIWAEAGAIVTVTSLEMPKRSYIKRIHAVLARGDLALQQALRSKDLATRQKALSKLPKLAGSIKVLDPSDAPMNTRTMAMLATECEYLIIDHIGLVQSASGKRSVEDYRVAAEVSNTLKEHTLSQGVGILAAAQVNREGESSGYLPPKIHHLAGADDLGRDADTIVMQRRMGERSMLHDLAKHRNGVPIRWYSKFEPATADFTEITKDIALDRARTDGDRLADA